MGRKDTWLNGLAIFLLLMALSFAGCDSISGMLGMGKADDESSGEETSQDDHEGTTGSSGSASGTLQGSSVQQVQFDSEKILVGTFNIKKLGVSKMNKPQARRVIVEIARRFDVIAIQELQAKDQWVIPKLVEEINQPGYGFTYIVGPRQGRTSNKEQYVFLFDTNRVELIEQPFMVNDPGDKLHREPMVARFRCKVQGPRPGFTFMLVNIHTDPDDTRVELPALADIVQELRRTQSHEDDLIVLGDLNEAPKKFGVFGQIPNWQALIPSNVPTNTRRTKCYDNIVYNPLATRELVGNHGVLDIEREFNLSQVAALDVSDHLPVWAQFSVYESGAEHVASGQGNSQFQNPLR